MLCCGEFVQGLMVTRDEGTVSLSPSAACMWRRSWRTGTFPSEHAWQIAGPDVTRLPLE
jgi:hypothetical protein